MAECWRRLQRMAPMWIDGAHVLNELRGVTEKEGKRIQGRPCWPVSRAGFPLPVNGSRLRGTGFECRSAHSPFLWDVPLCDLLAVVVSSACCWRRGLRWPAVPFFVGKRGPAKGGVAGSYVCSPAAAVYMSACFCF